MATTWYIDPVNGNDTRAGTSWATSKRYLYPLTSVAPGDSVRFAKTSDPLQITGATFSCPANSNKLTLSANLGFFSFTPLSQTSWVAANGTTITSNTWSAPGAACPMTASSNWYTTKFLLPSGLTANTKYAYTPLATGTWNFSAAQEICLWIYIPDGSVSWVDGSMRFCLCSDTLGATIVDSFPIKFSDLRPVGQTGTYMFAARTGGGNLGASIQSFALYTGASGYVSSGTLGIFNVTMYFPTNAPFRPGDVLMSSDKKLMFMVGVCTRAIGGGTAYAEIDGSTYDNSSVLDNIAIAIPATTLYRYRPYYIPKADYATDCTNWCVPFSGGVTRVSISGGWNTTNDTQDGMSCYDIGRFNNQSRNYAAFFYTTMQNVPQVGIDFSKFGIIGGGRGILSLNSNNTVCEYTVTDCWFYNSMTTGGYFNTSLTARYTNVNFCSCWLDTQATAGLDLGFTNCTFFRAKNVTPFSVGSVFFSGCYDREYSISFGGYSGVNTATLTNFTMVGGLLSFPSGTNPCNISNVSLDRTSVTVAPGAVLGGPVTLVNDGSATYSFNGNYLIHEAAFAKISNWTFTGKPPTSLYCCQMTNCSFTFTTTSVNGFDISLNNCTLIGCSILNDAGSAYNPNLWLLGWYSRHYNCTYTKVKLVMPTSEALAVTYLRQGHHLFNNCNISSTPNNVTTGPQVLFVNCTLTPINLAALTLESYPPAYVWDEQYMRIFNHNGTGVHYAIGNHSAVKTETTTVHTASTTGFKCTTDGVVIMYEDDWAFTVGEATLLGGKATTIDLWVNPVTANSKIAFKARRGQFERGQPELRAISVGTGWQKLTLTYTPTVSGVLEVYVTPMMATLVATTIYFGDLAFTQIA